MLKVNSEISVPLREIKFSFSRSSGPGGQNVNKVNTKVQLRWNIDKTQSLPEGVRQRIKTTNRRRVNSEGELMIYSQRFRDQGQNVADCLNKLKELIQVAAKVPKKRRPTKITKRAKQKRLDNKRRQSDKKQSRRWSGQGD